LHDVFVIALGHGRDRIPVNGCARKTCEITLADPTLNSSLFTAVHLSRFGSLVRALA